MRKSRLSKFLSKVSKYHWKPVVWALALSGLTFFIAKDFIFKKKSDFSVDWNKLSATAPVTIPKALPKKEPPPPRVTAPRPSVPPVVRPAKQGRMAIVLDDWGNNYSLLRAVKDLKQPVTLAIIPNLPHSRRIAEEAAASRLGVIIHMPMQPFDERQPLEPHTIKVKSSEEEIHRYLEEAIRSVPRAEGLNNHMGSAVTSDLRAMRAVLAYLKKKNLFFIDSNVISTTVGPQVAEETGIAFAKRDVFIDNEPNKAAIREKLEEARDIALDRGQVIVIGHDKQVTLDALKEAMPRFAKQGIRFVLVKELVEKP
jgi:hypothetical protein